MNHLPIEYLFDGMSQKDRVLPALPPDYVQIDDRDIFDLSNFIYNISAQFNYYNEFDQVDGDWQSFFGKNLYVLNGIISSLDEKKILENYKKQKENINSSININSLREATKELLRILESVGHLLIDVSDKVEYAKLNIENIHEEIEHDYNALYRNYSKIQKVFNQNLDLDFHPIIKKKQHTIANDHEDLNDFNKQKQTINALLLEIDDHYAQFTAHYLLLKYHLNNSQPQDNHYDPYASLIITFLTLFKHVQDQINGFTKKHLEYYYNNILQLVPKPARADRAYLVIDLVNNIDEIVINAGTIFIAKPGGNPPNIEYKLIEDTIINRASVAELKTVFIEDIDMNRDDDSDEMLIYYANNPLNDLPTMLKQPDSVKTWPVFGESQRNLSVGDQTMEFVDMGFVISSPLFYLKEGSRKLCIRIYFNAPRNHEINKNDLSIDDSSFTVFITGEKDWLEIDNYKINFINGVGEPENPDLAKQPPVKGIEIDITLKEDDPAIFLYNPLCHGGSYSLDFPAVKLLLNNYGTFKVYPIFKGLEIQQVKITADVNYYQNVKLQNSLGLISPGAPFQLFGPIPNIGSYLDIKDTNVFNKYTKSFTITLEWLDLPRQQGGFYDYYREYDTDITNESFKIKIGSVVNGNYTTSRHDEEEFLLFNEDSEQYLITTTTINIPRLINVEWDNNMKLAAEAADTRFINGVIRLELIAPSDAFGHRIFPQIFSRAAMDNARVRLFRKQKTLPDNPYIPVLKKISINYTLEQTEIFNANNSTGELQTTQIYPFGFYNSYPKSKFAFSLLPKLLHTATLYVGLKNIQPGRELSLLIKFSEENSYRANYIHEKVFWYYLSNNQWRQLDNHSITLDTTNDLVCSGVIRIKIPEDMAAGNTIMDPDLFWLMAGVNNPDNKQFKIIGIYAQVAVVERVMTNNESGAVQDYVMLPNSITGLMAKNQKIQTIRQPFYSFGGREAPSVENYYVTSSERLRHKQRPVLIIDLLQAVLENFPEILIAKCINGNNAEYIPTEVNLYIVVMKKVTNYLSLNENQVSVNIPLLTDIQTYLKTITSPFAKIKVGNVTYEKIKVVCSVVFNAENTLSDDGYYTRKLYDDIKIYIAPWLTDPDADIKIGAKLNYTNFLSYIKNLPYVSYVSGFSLLHFFTKFNAERKTNVNSVNDFRKFDDGFIQSSVPEAVFFPTDSHVITVIKKEEKNRNQEPAGIDNLSVGGELVITDHELIAVSPAENKEQGAPLPENEIYEFTINI